jgi:alpha-glucoside transport system substrate-binding protein
VVEVFGPVVGGQGERLGQALAEVSEGSGVELRYVGVTPFAEQLADRLAQGDRPDIALLPQPGVLEDLYERGLVAPLPEAVATDVRRSYPGGLVDLVTIDGQPRATWLTTDVKGLLWYRPAELAALGVQVPASLDELTAVSEQIRTGGSGVAPWCLSMEAGSSTGWVGTDWVEGYVLRRLGPAAYDRWTTGELAFDSPEITAVFDELDELLRAPGAVAGGPKAVLTVPWEQAAPALVDTPSRCALLHQADFIRRSFPEGTSVGPDGDVDVVPLPPSTPAGSAPLTLGGTMAVPLDGSPEAAEAMALLSSTAMATALDRTGIFLSPRLGADVPPATDPTAERLLELVRAAPVVRFDGSDLMAPAVGTGTFWEGMRAFFSDERVPAVLEDIQAGWSEATAAP